MNTRKRAQQARPTGSAADQSTGENEAFAAKTRPLVGKKPKSAAVATNNNIAVAAASIINTPVTTAAAAATATTSIIPTSTADQSTGKTEASSAAKRRPVLQKKASATAILTTTAATAATNSTAPATATLSTVHQARSDDVDASIPALSYCSWWASLGAGGCIAPTEKMESCTRCVLRVHPRCQIIWEEMNNYDNDTCVGVFCYSHHPHQVSKLLNECRKASGATIAERSAMVAERSSCDWTLGESNVCAHYSLPTKECGVDGCCKPVHHLCQIKWEEENEVELSGGKLRCREHHPHFNLCLGGVDGKQPAALMSSLSPLSPPLPAVLAPVLPRIPPAQPAMRSPIQVLRSYISSHSPLFGSSPAESSHAESTITRHQNEEHVIAGRANQRQEQTDTILALAMATATTTVTTTAALPMDIDGLLDVAPDPYIDEEMEVDNSFWDDIRECGNGEDSDQEGSVSGLHNAAVRAKTIVSTSGKVVDDDADCIDEEGVPSDAAAEVEFTATPPGSILNAPNGWKPPCAPESWTGYTACDKRHDAPEEEDIDNPGCWDLFSFRPKYSSDKKYIGHFTPAGAKVLKSNAAGKRIIDGWQLYYNGWHCDEFDKGTYVRGDATRENLKPSSRQGCLDVNVLTKHGLTAGRVANDPLWFLQMLFPLCQPQNSTVDDDQRIPFFTQVDCSVRYVQRVL